MALKSTSDGYDSLKGKLIKWADDGQDRISKKIRRKFETARKLPGETLRVFACRLEKLFLLVHPRREPEFSSTLRRRFLEAIPRTYRKEFTATQRLTSIVGGRDNFTWSAILSFASKLDAEGDATTSGSDISYEEVEVYTVPGQFSAQAKTRVDRNRSPSSFTNFVPSPVASNGKNGKNCYFCKKTGHFKSDCRKFKGLCFACGSAAHRLAQCPTRSTISRQAGTSYQPKRSVTFQSFPDLAAYDYREKLETFLMHPE